MVCNMHVYKNCSGFYLFNKMPHYVFVELSFWNLITNNVTNG